MALTDQLDLFASAVSRGGYSCKALVEAKGVTKYNCCHWCHTEGTKYRVPLNGLSYITCCDHIYGDGILHEDVILIADNPNGIGYDP